MLYLRGEMEFSGNDRQGGYSCKEDLIAAALESKLIVTTLK